MKIILDKDDVMELICEKYYRNTTYGRKKPEKNEIYWEDIPGRRIPKL